MHTGSHVETDLDIYTFSCILAKFTSCGMHSEVGDANVHKHHHRLCHMHELGTCILQSILGATQLLHRIVTLYPREQPLGPIGC
jgi:hypothetical protein